MFKTTKCFPLIIRDTFILSRRFIGKKRLKNEDIKPIESSINAYYLTKIVGGTHIKWSNILKQHPELLSVKRKDLFNTANFLKSLNYESKDIVERPMILYYNCMTLENRYAVLQECGYHNITVSILSKYVTFMNKSVTQHKALRYIPSEIDVEEKLRSCFTDINVHLTSKCSENLEIKKIRQRVLECYLKQRLNMTEEDIVKMWKVYSRVRHKNFRSVQSMIEILLQELNFPIERITKNAYLLYGEPNNVKLILSKIKTLAGVDFKEILFRRPKILMTSCEALLKTIEHVKSFNIGEEAIIRCIEILTLGPDTVLERLEELNEIEEFRVLVTNPRILRLVHYQNKARLRLEYLNQLKVRCASLHILSCGSEAFAKFTRDGSDKTKGRDIVIFLSQILKEDENSLRSSISRHPNWCHIPVTHVKQCYDFLIAKKFKPQDILKNIHVLLYPIDKIEEKLKFIYNPEKYEELQIAQKAYELTNSQILNLILYLIEYEFHFTGDGIWTEQNSSQVENFNNLLDFPESLNKVYKYGVKPTTNNVVYT